MKKNGITGFFRPAQGCSYSLDDISTGRNNNVLINGGSGTGKTMNIVTPAIYEATGSYYIVDPKGRLYGDYSEYLRRKGYRTYLIDFTEPLLSDGYNPLEYTETAQDIMKLAELVVDEKSSQGSRADPFWDLNCRNYFCALAGYLRETGEMPLTFTSIAKLNAMGERNSDDDKGSLLSSKFSRLAQRNPESWAYQKFTEVDVAPYKTYDSIRVTLSGKLSKLDTKELRDMMERGGFDFADTAVRKSAVFVTVSDTDRSMDFIANMFFTQAMNRLCEFADKVCDGRLPIPVRFILDDFATNCTISEFPRMISSIRSRGISVMLIIQAESQLEASYGRDFSTIISNCDTYVYLGSNDLDTAQSISRRCDRPLSDILYMPRGQCWVFRSGELPVNSRLIDAKPLIREMLTRQSQEQDRRRAP